ncbi:MAG: hypothetical protein WB767_05820 [Nocardioides sp.]
MPTPAFEKLKQAVTGVVAISEKAVRTATPIVRRTTEEVVNRIRGASDGHVTPATAQTPDAPAPHPTPAAIAKNVAHQRPVAATPPRAPKKPKPSDSPGGKLPPRG